MPKDYNPSTYILGEDIKTTKKTTRKRPGLFLPMNRETMSKASIIYTKSGCKSWQEFFEKLWNCQGAVITVIKEEPNTESEEEQ